MNNMIKTLLKQKLSNKFFSITFIKKNGESRKLHGRLGVKKYLVGKELPYNTIDYNYLIAYDIKNKGYITINLDTIKELKIYGQVITF